MALRTRSIPQKNNCVPRWFFFSALAVSWSLSFLTLIYLTLQQFFFCCSSSDCLVKEKQYYCCVVDLFTPSFKAELCAVFGPFHSLNGWIFLLTLICIYFNKVEKKMAEMAKLWNFKWNRKKQLYSNSYVGWADGWTYLIWKLSPVCLLCRFAFAKFAVVVFLCQYIS